MTVQLPAQKVDFQNIHFAISPLLLFPDAFSTFRVFLKTKGRYVLYTREKEVFTPEHRNRLFENNVKVVHVLTTQKKEFETYLKDNLGKILTNELYPVEQRATVLYESAQTIAEEVFRDKLAGAIKPESMDSLRKLMAESVKFLKHEDTFKKIGPLIRGGHQIFTHSVNVMIITLSILKTYDMDEETMVQTGIGALLHDIGKTGMPAKLIRKQSDFTPRELDLLRAHPMRGVGRCSMLPLDHIPLKCILLHHEREDGQGYPAGLQGKDIPLPVKALIVANIYDNTTTHGSGDSGGMKPFKALSHMNDALRGAYNPEVYKRLVMILSGAGLI